MAEEAKKKPFISCVKQDCSGTIPIKLITGDHGIDMRIEPTGSCTVCGLSLTEERLRFILERE